MYFFFSLSNPKAISSKGQCYISSSPQNLETKISRSADQSKIFLVSFYLCCKLKKWDFLVSFGKSREKKRKCESLWWKTTIVLKINGEDTSVISPTLGFNIKTITYQKYTLNIWDVGGQRTIRSYWRNYFEQTDGLVWVVDSSDLRRLDDCKMELDNLLKEEDYQEHPC
ncbi:ADP-ribosylation factor-like protein 2 [Gossypium hirsutum]|uniref:ADP-ribosylation factor-like protein 2 n=1 Tax=Gossypium hirsutum TaxID=3635 RepID=A0ABM2Z4S3_GOSHI|nr:ADP-ribosylation factor-like protein 2 [Gossypium hirsutum]